MLAARTSIASTSALSAAPSSSAHRHAPSRGALVVTAASKKKDVRLQVTLECTEQRESGVMGMSRYITQKVRTTMRVRVRVCVRACVLDDAWVRARADTRAVRRDSW